MNDSHVAVPEPKVEVGADKVNDKKPLTDKERAALIINGEIAHWRHLEKGVGSDKTFVAKKIGALRFVAGLIEKL